MKNTEPTTRQQVMEAFGDLRERYHEARSQIETRSESAARAEEDDIVTRAATYSVEGLVKELADLQLAFGDTLDQLGNMLVTEDHKLDELRRSIDIEERQLDRLDDVQIAAEALTILTREHDQREADFEQTRQRTLSDLTERIETARARWQADAERHERDVEEWKEQVAKERAEDEADFEYERQRRRKEERDALEKRERTIRRDLKENEEDLERDWAKRTKVLEEHADEIAALERRVAEYPDAIDAKVKEARADAIHKTAEDARHEAELNTEQYRADEEVAELKVEALKESIVEQREHIAELEGQLSTASSKAQQLAIRAIDGSSRKAN